jgi:polyhydroxybutyrate depolymerase
MRTLALVLALGCGEATPDKLDTAVADDAATDTRFDPSTWPETVGGDRPVTVHTPESWDGRSALPVLVVLHGYSATGAFQDLYFGSTDRMERESMIVVAPDGTPDSQGFRFWNAADACCDFERNGVDDVAYLSDMLDELETYFPVDRFVLLGHSNGGFMAHRLGCELGDRITAIASLAGSNEARDCVDTRPSVLQIHGTLDDTILDETNSWTLGARDSIELWVEAAGCRAVEEVGQANYALEVPGAETRIERWSGCPEGFAAELWTMEETGHIPAPTNKFLNDVHTWLLSR